MLKNYGPSHGIKRGDVYVVEGKKKRAYFDDEPGEGAAE